MWAVRQLVETHYRPVLGDEQLLERLTVTAHELLENAAKYGSQGLSSQGLSSLRIQLTNPSPMFLRISVRNPIDHERLPALRVFFDEMSRAANPFEFYQQRIRRAAQLKEGSGLGLARISCEAEMNLSLEISERHVSLTAVTRLANGKGAA